MLNIERYKEEIVENIKNGNTLCLAAYRVMLDLGLKFATESTEERHIKVLNWLTSEHKESILTNEEREYLSNVIKPFKVKWIKLEKEVDTDNTFLVVAIQQFDGFDEEWDLPTFKKDTMYKGMKLNKSYTLEELGL